MTQRRHRVTVPRHGGERVAWADSQKRADPFGGCLAQRVEESHRLPGLVDLVLPQAHLLCGGQLAGQCGDDPDARRVEGQA
jgi:hypothetical protein